MKPWFTVTHIDENYSYHQRIPPCGGNAKLFTSWHRKSALVDTGLGIGNIYKEVRKLTDKPVTAVATHIHWDHIGGHNISGFLCPRGRIELGNGGYPCHRNGSSIS